MTKYKVEAKDRCPECGAPFKVKYRYPEETIKTGKGKIKKEETGRTVVEWECSRCGNTGHYYE